MLPAQFADFFKISIGVIEEAPGDGCHAGISGPICRGDFGTVWRHMLEAVFVVFVSRAQDSVGTQ